MPRRGEIVLASSQASIEAHKSLYHFGDDTYVIAGGDIIGSVAELPDGLSRVHISSPWEDMVRLAVWKSEPAKGDILLLLIGAGITVDQLHPFRESEVSDIFPWLYYGRRLDVLRKICRIAKTNTEKHIKSKDAHVYCHLTSEATKSIVASSL